MLLLYISEKKNSALFTKWLEEQGVFTDFTDIEEFPALRTAWEKKRMLANYDYILFYFDATPLPEDDILAVITYVRRFHHARIIIFAPKETATASFFSRLVGLGLRELVLFSKETDLKRELSECLSSGGKIFSAGTELLAHAHIETAAQRTRPRLVIPGNFRLTVGVAGAQSRVGVTTQAFSLYHALRSLGFIPCIIDKGQDFIMNLYEIYAIDSTNDGSVVTVRGIPFSHDIQVGTGHNAFICDLGILSPETRPAFESCDIRFLCAGTKAWEIPYLKTALNDNTDIIKHIIFSFSSNEEEHEMRTVLGKDISAAFAPWNPELWDEAGREWQEELLLPLLSEVLGA